MVLEGGDIALHRPPFHCCTAFLHPGNALKRLTLLATVGRYEATDMWPVQPTAGTAADRHCRRPRRCTFLADTRMLGTLQVCEAVCVEQAANDPCSLECGQIRGRQRCLLPPPRPPSSDHSI